MTKKEFQPNTLFWETRAALGLSRPDVADIANQQPVLATCEHVPLDENYIGRIEQGRIGGGMCRERAAALCIALEVAEPALIGLVAARRAPTRTVPDPSRSGPLAEIRGLRCDVSSDEHSHYADAPDAVESPEDLVAIFDGLTAAANVRGWPSIHPMALRQLRGFDQMRRQGQAIQERLSFVESRWAEFMSWICDNGGSEGGDQWLARAHASAIAANDQHLGAYILMRKGQRALDNGDAHSAVGLSRRALKEENLTPKIQALCLIRLAEGLALAGDEESVDLLMAASTQANTPSERPEDLIAQHCDDRYVLAVQARCRQFLGRRSEAIAIIDDILTDPTPAAPIDRAMWLIYRADAQVHTDPEDAAATGYQALGTASPSTSARVVRALLPLAVSLRPHSHLENVQSFLTAHRAALTSLLAV